MFKMVLAILCMVCNVIMMTISVMAFITNQNNYVLYRDTSIDKKKNKRKYEAIITRKRKYRFKQALWFVPKTILFIANVVWVINVLE